MQTESNTPRIWQIHLGIWGSVIWFGALQTVNYFQIHKLQAMQDATSGYAIGFITAFAGYISREILLGRGNKFFDKNRFLKWL